MTSTIHFGRSTLVGPRDHETIRRQEGRHPAELMCICALCKCGKHRCPLHPPGAQFAGETTYMSEYVPKRVPQYSPVQVPARIRPGTCALPGSPVRPQSARWLGRTTYQVDYLGDTGDRATILRQHVPLAAPMDGRTTYRTAYDRDSYDGPMRGPRRRGVPVPMAGIAPFEGTTEYTDQYVPKEGRRPDSAYRPQSAATGLRFTGMSEYSDAHCRPMPLPHRQGPYSHPYPHGLGPDDRDWHTEHEVQYPPKEPLPDDFCPAARLPRPPPAPEHAPQAWEGQPPAHVLWDTTKGEWAITYD